MTSHVPFPTTAESGNKVILETIKGLVYNVEVMNARAILAISRYLLSEVASKRYADALVV